MKSNSTVYNDKDAIFAVLERKMVPTDKGKIVIIECGIAMILLRHS